MKAAQDVPEATFAAEVGQTRHRQAGEAIERMKYFTEQVMPSREKLVELQRKGVIKGGTLSPRPRAAPELMPSFGRAVQHGFAPPPLLGEASPKKALYKLPSSSGRPDRGSMRPMAQKSTSLKWAGGRKKTIQLEEDLVEPERTQAQRVEFVRSVGIRTATETMREQRKREDMAVKWRQHQDERADVPAEGRHLQAYLQETEDPGKFLYIPSRDYQGRQTSSDFKDATEAEIHAEPVKVLCDLAKIDEKKDPKQSRPASQASTALDSRPASARASSGFDADSRPQSARPRHLPASRPSSAVGTRPPRPSSARPPSHGEPPVGPVGQRPHSAVLPRSVRPARPGSGDIHGEQRPVPLPSSVRPSSARPQSRTSGDPLSNGDFRLPVELDEILDLEMEVAEINGLQEEPLESAVSATRLRRTSVADSGATASSEFLYQGQPLLPVADADDPPPSPLSPDTDTMPSPRPLSPLARALEEADIQSEEDESAVEPLYVEGYFSMLSIRELFTKLDPERKGFITRRELLFALNEHKEIYHAFCRYYIQVEEEYMYWCEQIGQEALPPGGVPPPEAENPRFVDDWRSTRRAVDVKASAWESDVKDFIFKEPEKKLPGRKALIIRKSLEFLDEACKQVALQKAPGQAHAGLHQKCYKLTLEILVNYFKMQGLLTEFCTAQILNQVPLDFPEWVNQEPVAVRRSSLDKDSNRPMVPAAADDVPVDETQEAAGDGNVPIEEEAEQHDEATEASGSDQGSRSRSPRSHRKATRDLDQDQDDDDPPGSGTDSEEDPLDAELALADANAAEAFAPGVYVLTRRSKVLRSHDVINPPSVGEIIKEFKAGTFLNIMSFHLLPKQRLLRGSLAQPADGWIDVKNFKNEECFIATPQESSQVEYHPRRHDGTDDPKDVAPIHARKEDGPGLYVLTRPVSVVAMCWNIAPEDDDILEELDEGALVTVEEVQHLYQEGRIRARLAEPDGWITLLNTENGRRWAMKAEEMQRLKEQAAKDQEEIDEDEDEVASEYSSRSSPKELLQEFPSEVEEEGPFKEEMVEETLDVDEELAEESGIQSEEPATALKSTEEAHETASKAPSVQEELHEDEPVAETQPAQTEPEDDDEAVAASEPEEDGPGLYILTRTAFVSPSFENVDPDDDELVDELDEGTRIRLVEVVLLEEENRLRARLVEPDGWITLKNLETGRRWADKLEDDAVDVEVPTETEALPPDDASEGSVDEDESSDGSQSHRELRKVTEPESEISEDEDEGYGLYVLTRTAFVAAACQNISPDDDEILEELEEGTSVRILEIVDLEEYQRRRARLAHPAGWITLENMETGRLWAVKQGDEVAESAPVSEDESIESPLVSPRSTVPAPPDTDDQSEVEVDDGHDDASEDEVDRSNLGIYVLKRMAFVSPSCDKLNPEDDEVVAELNEGALIQVEEIETFGDHLRARVDVPAGWITLKNTATGKFWAIKQGDVVPEDILDRDTSDDESLPERPVDTASLPVDETSEVEVEEAEEADDGALDTFDDDEDATEDGPGVYILKRMVFVSPSCENLDPTDEELVDEIEEGTLIRVQEVIFLEREQRVRARLLRPRGWITLRNTETGRRWAVPRGADTEPHRADEVSDQSDPESEVNFQEGNSEDSRSEAASETPEAPPWKGMVVYPDVGSIFTDAELCARSSEVSARTTAPHFQEQYPIGDYVVLQPSLLVSPDPHNFNPSDDVLVEELEQGQVIQIVEILEFRDEKRVRAKLEDPVGWITLMDGFGTRGAVLKENWHSNPQDLQEDAPGLYMLKRIAFVTEKCENINPEEDDIIDELDEGRMVRVEEIAALPHQLRVRARLAHPPGWITLVNMETGRRWAMKADETLPEQPGLYELLAPVTVSPSAPLLMPNDEQVVDDLEKFTKVNILEIVKLDERIRGRLQQPSGWITLRNLQSGTRFARFFA